MSRATVEVSDVGESTEEEDDNLTDELLSILLLLLLMRGSKVYNEGIALALSSGFDVSKTTKFVSSITDADTVYMKDIVKSFDGDTKTEIEKLITAAVKSGATTDEIKKQLASFKDAQTYRVERFAQNEAWRISEIAGLRAMKQLDGELNLVQKATTYKTWNIQSSACPVCIDYASISVKIDEQFFGGIDGPPAHVTCRCKLSYSIVKEEATDKLELHCASCDRFLGITDKAEATDQLKCSNSKCRALEVPVVKAPSSASS